MHTINPSKACIFNHRVNPSNVLQILIVTSDLPHLGGAQ
ncbi:hypothetical protein QFZ84_003443 [Pseudomonas fluorescens]